MRLTRAASMRCAPKSYRYEFYDGGPYVTGAAISTGTQKVVDRLGLFEDMGYEPEDLKKLLGELKKTENMDQMGGG